MKKSDEQKRKEYEETIQSVNSGRELERIKKQNKKSNKKHFNHED